MLQQGRHTRRFFNRKVVDGNIQYQLKSRKQYMDETQQVEKPNKKTYSTNDLMDLILTNPMPRKQMNPSEKNQGSYIKDWIKEEANTSCRNTSETLDG